MIFIMTDCSNYPIYKIVPEICHRLAEKNRLVVSAPPGAGKSTVLPLELLRNLNEKGDGGKIIMLEPRRLAAVAVANRLASLLGEECGNQVGYWVKLERKISAATRIEVVTEGIFIRIIQQDPELKNYSMVLFDEYHERSINGDLALALTLESAESFRNDLKLLVMSATLDVEQTAQFINGDCVASQGKLFPVKVLYRRGNGGNEKLPVVAAEAVLRALELEHGSILVFLPGEREIMQVYDILRHRLREPGALKHFAPEDVVLHPLFGRLSLTEQRAAIEAAAPPLRKVVLSTNIAESSLTIEGVRVVIDSGLVGCLRYNPQCGMSKLESVWISKASAEQRRGRAGRLEEGVCLRLWDETRDNLLADFAPPEIVQSELSDFALELFKWGVKSPEELNFPDYPNPGMWSDAVALLRRLGAVGDGLRLTPYGEKIYRAALHPRLGDMLLRGIQLQAGYLACKLAALLSEGSGGGFSEVDLDKILLNFDRGKEFERFRRLADNLASRFRISQIDSADEPGMAAVLLAHAFPDFIGMRRNIGNKRYLLSCGRGAIIHERSDYGGGKFIVCADLDAGEAEAQIKLAVTLAEKDFYQLFESQFNCVGELEISDDFSQVRIDEVVKFGSLELERRRALKFEPSELHQAILAKIRKNGIGILPLPDKVKSFMGRMNLAHKYFPEEDFLPLSEEFLLENLDLWLESVLPDKPGKNLLDNIDYMSALKNLFSYNTLKRLDDLAPEKINFVGDVSRTIDYLSERPTLSCHIQDFYGCDALPKIMAGRETLLVKMLSPAGRVVQICDDLANFWRGSYKYVRSEMRSRYPKHNWPEEPWRPESRGRLKKKLEK